MGAPRALLHVHSTSSPLWGVHSPSEVVKRAKALGYDRIALTDRNGLYGLFLFLDSAREEGVDAMIGAEIHSPGGERAILWTKNIRGYKNLCRLLSARHCDPSFRLADALPPRRDGLVAASDHKPLLLTLARASRRDLYVELSPGHGMHEALKFAREHRIPPVATTRAVGFDQGDIALHRVLRAVAHGTKLSRLASF